ncbi:MAG: ASKHA domain-containing protein [Desulfobacterales bacterium]|nr:ASKHA domain-containing protein [Desulfobacterales bacterium]
MTKETYIVELLPHGRKIPAGQGQTLIDALRKKNIVLRSDCGGKGKCKKCRVNKYINDGTSKEEILACTHTVESSLKIQIPKAALFSTHTIGKAAIALPKTFTQRFNNPATNSDKFGIAADLGTTTIAVYLCHMAKGEVIASAVIKNPQALYGDDVMSRIGAIGQNPDNLTHLQSLVVGAMEEGIGKLVKSNGLDASDIEEMVVVGNPTMIHILSGVDPAPIGVSPYQPAFYSPKAFDSKKLGFNFGAFTLHTLPQVSGFIGGDILSAALAVDLQNQPEGTLLIDLGTNGELMLKGHNDLFATSCATGPAFEGATLSCGMQAVPGAINRVYFSSDNDLPCFEMIRNQKNTKQPPSGICGSGVVSAVAQFCKHKIIQPDGGFNTNNTSLALDRDDSGRYRYTIAKGTNGAEASRIFISQKDIRSVQLGKGALITGIDFLLKKARFAAPEKLIIAGAFGSYLDKTDMKTLGMIPNVSSRRIEMAGNAAGTGAVMALCLEDYRKKAQDMADLIKVVDLASDQDFHASFVHRLGFPEH